MITDRIGRHKVLLPNINHNKICDIKVIFNSESYIFAGTKAIFKCAHVIQSLRHDGYCAITLSY